MYVYGLEHVELSEHFFALTNSSDMERKMSLKGTYGILKTIKNCCAKGRMQV